MSPETNPRRDFFRLAGASIAGAAIAVVADQGVVHAAPSSPAAGNFDVKTFGATGDGKTLDTAAINKAIDAAAAAGGGTVIFPAGNYLSYSLHLKSNVTLHLEPGATIIAADPPAEGAAGYDLPEPNEWDMYQDFGHSHFHNSLIWGEGLDNIAITGTGRIWGKGLSKGYGPGGNAQTPGVGNKSISLKNCHNVLLRDFSILHGGHFGILATGIDNLTIDNLKIDTNRDGMDVDSCRNVRISNCYVNSPWDDGICLKADYALGTAKQTEFVTITNCYVSGCWEEGTLLDGTYKKFAPEVARAAHRPHQVRHRIERRLPQHHHFQLRVRRLPGAGAGDAWTGPSWKTLRSPTFRCATSSARRFSCGWATACAAPDNTPVGTLKRVIISNLVCSNCVGRLGSVISGIPGHYIEDVKISNVQVLHQGGGTKEDAAYQPPEYEDMYPEPTMFVGGPRPSGRGPDGRWMPEGAGRAGAGRGPGVPGTPGAPGAPGTPGAAGQGRGAAGAPVSQHHMPSHGFYVRHVKGIQFDNIEIRADKGRPAAGLRAGRRAGRRLLPHQSAACRRCAGLRAPQGGGFRGPHVRRRAGYATEDRRRQDAVASVRRGGLTTALPPETARTFRRAAGRCSAAASFSRSRRCSCDGSCRRASSRKPASPS